MSTDNTTSWPKELFEHYVANLNGHSNHPIANFRKSAFKAFSSSDLPTRRDEDWKYTSVSRIFNHNHAHSAAVAVTDDQLAVHHYEGLEAVNIVYVNGHLDAGRSDLSHLPDGLTIIPLSEALEDSEKAAWIARMDAVKGGTDQNVFPELNKAFAQEGIYISCANGAVLDRPVHIVHHNIATGSKYMTSPQLYIRTGKSSVCTVIESHYGERDAEYFSNILVRAEVAPNAHVDHYKIQRDSRSAIQISNTIAVQQRDSIFSSHVVDLGGGMVRNNLSTDLADSNTETNYYGVYVGDGSQHIDNQTYIDHAVPHCYSNELYKGILTDKARGVFNGKVMVRQDAQKTNAFQQNSSLVLSPTAVMDAKPQLEIYADDVKCSHGATIGQLDEGSVFYLRSRGIPEVQAKTLLQKAFVGEVVMNFKETAVRDAVLAMLVKKINRLED